MAVLAKGCSKLEATIAVLGRMPQLMGEELSGLSAKDLLNLESQLDMSLKGDRTKKVSKALALILVSIFDDEIKELNKKLSQPQIQTQPGPPPQNNEVPAKAIKLGYLLMTVNIL
ncbi:hypothetical protein DVH24_037949 [Malus domestica]|uniref:K-box domain-containing protein n=1 Tax=Malus domestica TaxID=3750 RepID=A0A498JYJ1_MALDO|nr:hypothetical protein DVH24_037949 [Malus domestica]